MRSFLFVSVVLVVVGCDFSATKFPPATKEKPPTLEAKASTTNTTTEKPKKEEPTKADELPTYTTVDIFNHYLQNEVGAKKRYSGKDMVISGHVWEIKSRTKNRAVVIMACVDLTTNNLVKRAVECHFDDADEVSNLRQSDRVRVRCRCNGKSFGTVNFGKCKLLEVLPRK